MEHFIIELANALGWTIKVSAIGLWLVLLVRYGFKFFFEDVDDKKRKKDEMNRFSMMKNAVKSWDDVFLRNKPLPATSEDVLDEPYKKSDLVYICISTTAKAIAQVPLVVKRYNEQTEAYEAVGDNHSWQVVLNRPNQLMDRYSFIEANVTYLMLDGDAFIIPVGETLSAGAGSLWVVREKYIKPVRDKQTNQLTGWSYRPFGDRNAIPLELGEVAHTFFWNPYDPINGFAPLQAGKISISTDYKAAKYNQIFFDKGTTIGGILSTEQKLSATNRDILEDVMRRKYEGYEQAHRTMLLEQGLKWTSTTPTHKDMAFTDLRNFDKEKILQVFGMKKSIISVTDDLNYATAKEQRKSWWQDTNIPIMRLIASALNFTIFDKYGLQVEFDTDSIEALQEDFNEKVKTAKELFGLGYTANEINARLGLGFDEKNWRDVWYKPMALQPVLEEEEEEPEQEPVPEEEPEEEEMTTTVTAQNCLLANFDEATREAMWKQVTALGTVVERVFLESLKRTFFDWRKLVLKWLYDQQEQTAAVSQKQPFVQNRPTAEISELAMKPFARLKDEADALYQEAALAGIETLALEMGVAIDVELLAQPEAVNFLQSKVIELVGDDNIKRTISKQLNSELAEGLRKQETIGQIADRFRGRFNSAAKRAKTIARTETYGALNFGRNAAFRESPFTESQWFTALDDRVRITHMNVHGNTKKQNEFWIVGGASLRFPGDPNGPAGEVINCRCIETVVMSSLRPISPTEEQ